jgi:outer membrane protein OmpA-like peptidoglycan-associated protein
LLRPDDQEAFDPVAIGTVVCLSQGGTRVAIKADRLMSGLFCLWLVLVNPPVWSGISETPQIYLAGIHGAAWTFSGSRSNCELSHEIPGFGIAHFHRLAGEELKFRIDSFKQLALAGDARLHEVSPPWIHREPDPLTRQVELWPGKMPIRLAGKSAAWLLASLAKGQIGSFDFSHREARPGAVSVQLSPVNYQRPYAAFRRCLREISDKGFLTYRHILLHFPFAGDELNSVATQRLDGLAGFVLADPSIGRIEITGHTDTKGGGSFNKNLSRRRAQSVYDYLVQAGIQPGLMKIEALGETRPVRRGHDERAAAANRRVEIKLIRYRPGSS